MKYVLFSCMKDVFPMRLAFYIYLSITLGFFCRWWNYCSSNWFGDGAQRRMELVSLCVSNACFIVCSAINSKCLLLVYYVHHAAHFQSSDIAF